MGIYIMLLGNTLFIFEILHLWKEWNAPIPSKQLTRPNTINSPLDADFCTCQLSFRDRRQSETERKRSLLALIQSKTNYKHIFPLLRHLGNDSAFNLKQKKTLFTRKSWGGVWLVPDQSHTSVKLPIQRSLRQAMCHLKPVTKKKSEKIVKR